MKTLTKVIGILQLTKAKQNKRSLLEETEAIGETIILQLNRQMNNSIFNFTQKWKNKRKRKPRKQRL